MSGDKCHRVVTNSRMPTLVADIAKGFVPVIVALNIGLAPTATAFVGSAPFLGHLYPIFLDSRAEKKWLRAGALRGWHLGPQSS